MVSPWGFPQKKVARSPPGTGRQFWQALPQQHPTTRDILQTSNHTVSLIDSCPSIFKNTILELFHQKSSFSSVNFRPQWRQYQPGNALWSPSLLSLCRNDPNNCLFSITSSNIITQLLDSLPLKTKSYTTKCHPLLSTRIWQIIWRFHPNETWWRRFYPWQPTRLTSPLLLRKAWHDGEVLCSAAPVELCQKSSNLNLSNADPECTLMCS